MKKNLKILKMAILYLALVVTVVAPFMIDKKAAAQVPPPASSIFKFLKGSSVDHRRVKVTVSWKENGVDKKTENSMILFSVINSGGSVLPYITPPPTAPKVDILCNGQESCLIEETRPYDMAPYTVIPKVWLHWNANTSCDITSSSGGGSIGSGTNGDLFIQPTSATPLHTTYTATCTDSAVPPKSATDSVVMTFHAFPSSACTSFCTLTWGTAHDACIAACMHWND